MYKDHNIDAVIYTDGNECGWYELKDKDMRKIANKTIHLQNQFKNGGQSSNRLARNRDIQRHQYIQMLAEKTVELFYNKTDNCEKISNILFCGSAEFKRELSEHKLITSFFTNIHVITMAQLDYDLIQETLGMIGDPMEKEHVDTITHMIDIADDKLVFGDEMTPMIDECMIETIYVHKDLEYADMINPQYKINIIKIGLDMINQYGGMIGVKFY
jgi:peptide subunit release factor 1 (eRF1)